ncbi:hypothetical protein [Thermoclostridium stercorarium]|uniref:hypothetical protein n=1 Tax=Thermoclostridium stercorarium TaxID=1510 RepID=UPI000A775EF7|nr:hypothetical protein [Thermoclostridium stercorarium]
MSVCLLVALTACGGTSQSKLQDGTYEGQSTPDSRGGYGIVKIESRTERLNRQNSYSITLTVR